MKNLKIIISGRVQGVFFRRFAKINAERLGIKGYVKNLSDGNVEINASSEKEKLDIFLNEIRRGPEGAYIEDIEISEIDLKNFNGFEIRY